MAPSKLRTASGAVFTILSVLFLTTSILLYSGHVFVALESPIKMPTLDMYPALKQLHRSIMEHGHVFIPASHPDMHYVGRWIPTANHLRQDTAFSGSYVEMTITNTSSVSVALQNAPQNPPVPLHGKNAPSTINQGLLGPIAHDTIPAPPVSVVFHLGEHEVYFKDDAILVVQLATDLDPKKTYRLRITHLGGSNTRDGVLQFEGIWLDRPYPETGSFLWGSTPPPRTLGRLLSSAELTGDPKTQILKKPIVEIFTSDGFRPYSEVLVPGSPGRMFKVTEDGVRRHVLPVWHSRLAHNLPLETVTITTHDKRLRPRFDGEISAATLFFRAGATGTPQFSRPWPFKSYTPSVLILQLGVEDYLWFFSNRRKADKPTLTKFINEFVEAYLDFVRQIRSTAYPIDSSTQSTAGSAEDGSYIYNSAPSTLPIFLMVPFSAQRYFVTKSLRLHTVLSEALSDVALTLQAGGDKSTFWIDTTGWVDSRHDMEPEMPHFANEAVPLSSFGDYKVSKLLADHLCPYILGKAADGPESEPLIETPDGRCAFDPYDHYRGSLFQPSDVEFERAVLDRKLMRLKERYLMGEVHLRLNVSELGKPSESPELENRISDGSEAESESESETESESESQPEGEDKPADAVDTTDIPHLRGLGS